MKAIVIGAGFGGIAAALRLCAKGYQVSLIDRCAGLGGRAQIFERDGFKHDAGPTVITAPFLFEELFSLFNEKFDDYVRLVPLTPWYRFHFSDNSHFNYGGTFEETMAEIARIEPNDCNGYRNLLAQSERIFNVGFTKLSAVSFHRLSTMLKQIPALLRLRSQDTVWKFVARYIKNPKLRQAFSIQPLLVGGNPFDTTSIYGLIHYLERAHGVHFAMGGTSSITNALGDLMMRQGINIQLNTTISQINIDDGVASGVTLEDGTIISADLIVSNADPAHLYTSMIKKEKQAKSARLKLANAEFSMGLFVLYFGTTRQYPDVAHHTIWLGERYKELLADIFDHKKLSQDFSLYLHRPTATDPSFAPAGCDSFYVLCPVPNLKGAIDWDLQGPLLQERIVRALDETILPGLRDTITSDFIMTPENFRTDYLSAFGAGFSVSPIFRQSAWFRFHNKAEGIENLFLVGAGTHPGAGLPGVLCSAKVIDSLVPSVKTVKEALENKKALKALKAADLVLSAKGKTFYWAREWMTPVHAARATRLYGFCRYVDDIADEGDLVIDPHLALNLIISDILMGSSKDSKTADFINLMRECNISESLVVSFIEGIISDLGDVLITNEESLIQYCYQVAGTVGAMMCKVLDCHNRVAISHAIDLGIAMQLTNISRDVVEDAIAGRCYLPATLINHLKPAQLVEPSPESKLIVEKCIYSLLKTADTYYKSGENGLSYLSFDSRFSILLASRIYSAIGIKIINQKDFYWRGRVTVSRLSKFLISFRTLIFLPFNYYFWFKCASHDTKLHGALTMFLKAKI